VRPSNRSGAGISFSRNGDVDLTYTVPPHVEVEKYECDPVSDWPADGHFRGDLQRSFVIEFSGCGSI
jgi:hypothetical protein